MHGGEMFIPITFFAAVVLILWVYFTNRNKERMALIEKGGNADMFRTKGNRLSSLKWGMLLVGIGIGILFGNIIETTTALEEETAYFSMIFLFGGIALISYYLIAGKLENKD
jgi:ABC-type Fe3+-siderophore transport system permease subunit